MKNPASPEAIGTYALSVLEGMPHPPPRNVWRKMK